MIYNLSVVNIIADAHREAINAGAALYGCGENNLSVKLVDANGNVFRGCHSYWMPDDYATFSDTDLRNAVLPSDIRPSFEYLYERLVLDGDAQENWQAALAENELSVVVETQ